MEIEPFLNHFHKSEKITFLDFELHILITGVGLMAATYQLTGYLNKNKPDLVIMAGIAGCFDKQTALGKVFVVKTEWLADCGVMEKKQWLDLFDLQLLHPNRFPFANRKLENKHLELMKRTRLTKVNAVTVNQIQTSPARNRIIYDKYKPKIESMEGAALHYVAIQEQVPFLQIRGVSNYIGDRNKNNWKISKAIGNCNKVLIRLFESL
jgi:futalosine hydrolase